MVENSTAYLVARSAGETFGIPAAPVVRVLRNLTVHGVPGAVPPLLGRFSYTIQPMGGFSMPRMPISLGMARL